MAKVVTISDTQGCVRALAVVHVNVALFACTAYSRHINKDYHKKSIR